LHQTNQGNGKQSAHKPKNVIAVDVLVLSQQDQPHIYRSIHQTAKAGVTLIISSCRSWFEVFKKTHARELTEANCYSRHGCSKLLLIDAIFIWFSNKMLFTLATLKILETGAWGNKE